MVEVGWLGIVMLEFVGGVGLGVKEVVLMMNIVVRGGGGMSVVLLIYINIFGLYFIVVFGMDD